MTDFPVKKHNKTVTQDYKLVHAFYRLDLRPKRLILLAVSHVDPTRSPKQQTPCKLTITAEQWVETFPDVTNPYRDLKAAGEALMGKFVHLKSTRSGKWIHWVREVEYHDDEGRITIHIEEELLPYLCAPGGLVQFSTLNLMNVSGLRTFGAIRLYELLNQFKLSGVRQITLDEIRGLLATDKAYPKFYEFRRWVLDKAVKEINAKTNLKVEFTQIKTGRSVTAIKFFVVESKQQDMFS